MNKIIYQFAIKVMAHDYQESLNILKDLIANLENHDEDNIIFLYVILLKELVQIEKLDSKIVENLYYTYQEKDELFNSFSNQIIKKDYNEALTTLLEIKKNETNKKRCNNLTTVLFEILLEDIKKEQELKEQQKLNNHLQIIKNEQEQQKLRRDYFLQNFKKLEQSIEEKNYDEALLITQDLVKNEPKMNEIKLLISKIIELKQNNTVLEDMHINYPESSDYSYIFNMAIKYHDYQSAYKNIGKCLYNNPNSRILKLYRELLYEINQINKQNQKNIKPQIINIEEINQNLYQKNFEKAKEQLELLIANDKNNDYQMYKDILKILRFVNNIKITKLFTKKKYIIYQEDPTKAFYEALECEDYKYAYQIVKDFNEDFKLYKIVLEYAVDNINMNKKVKKIKKNYTINKNYIKN